MGDSRKAIAEDEDDYERRCRKYGEKIQYSSGGSDCYGEHSRQLKAREYAENAAERENKSGYRPPQPMPTQFSAKDAAALVTKFREEGDENVHKSLDVILNGIAKHAKSGAIQMIIGRDFYSTYELPLTNILKKRGFGVTVVSDARDGDYMTITW